MNWRSPSSINIPYKNREAVGQIWVEDLAFAIHAMPAGGPGRLNRRHVEYTETSARNAAFEKDTALPQSRLRDSPQAAGRYLIASASHLH
jgi:hypothetical protein